MHLGISGGRLALLRRGCNDLRPAQNQTDQQNKLGTAFEMQQAAAFDEHNFELVFAARSFCEVEAVLNWKA